MSLISIEEFRGYTGQVNADDTLAAIYIGAASDVVIDYLGYNPALADYDEYLDGSGLRRLRLASKPVTVITAVEIDGVAHLQSEFRLSDEYLTFIDSEGIFPRGDENVRVQYSAGYAVIPEIMKMITLRIAALLNTEADGNIGVTSKSFGDSGTRSFQNFTKFDRYLSPLNRFRINRL